MTDRAQRSSRLLERYAQSHPAEFAQVVARTGGSAATTLLASLPESALPAVVVHLPREIAGELLVRSADSELVRWLSEADLDSAVGLARRLDPLRRGRLADWLPARRRRELDRYCSFPDTCAGAYVERNFTTVSETQSIADAVRTLGSSEAGDRMPLLVVDREGRLLGWLDTHLALLRGPGGSVRECLAPVRPLQANARLYAAVAAFAARDEPWLPVVDARSIPIGLLHRSRIPDASTPPGAGAPSVLAVLAATLFELLAELPALTAVERRTP